MVTAGFILEEPDGRREGMASIRKGSQVTGVRGLIPE